MKLICDGMDLAEAVNTVARATNTRALNPILEGIKLTAKNGTLTLAATDLEMYIQKTIRADITAEGTCVVPGRLFSEYCQKLGRNSVGLGLNGDTMEISHGDNLGKFQCLLLIEYPDIVNINKKPHFSIKCEHFRDFITKARVSVSNDDSRPILKGVLCEIGKDKITGVALDGFRLTRVEKPITNHSEEKSVIIPGRSLDEVKKLIADDNGEVSIVIDNKFFQVTLNKTIFAGRLIDGEYINYKQILPSKFDGNVVIERAAFAAAVDRAGLLVRNDKVNLVTLTLADKFVTIFASNDNHRINERVAANLSGKDMKISFNARYLADVLNATTDEFLKMSYSGELSPCIIESAKPCDYLFLVLPVRL